MAYTYDKNGSLTNDQTKGISKIEYNYLNLPKTLSFALNKKLDYIYDAAGTKLMKRATSADLSETKTYYAGNMIYGKYKDLSFILTDEGRAVTYKDFFAYEYNIKDHLGNVRMVIKEDGLLLQENHYYPFGLVMQGLGVKDNSYYKNNYLYNGKEMQDDFGLGWEDYGARMLDTQLPIFTTIDPHAEKYYSWSPYSYCKGNPINRIDPDGQDGIKVIDVTNKTITVKATYFVQTENREYFTTGGKTKYLSGYNQTEIAKMQVGYNKYLNKLSLTVSDGDYKGYSVKFDLQFKPGGTVENSEKSAKNETEYGFSIGNSLTVGNDNSYSKFKSTEIDNGDGTVSSSIIGGVTFGNKDIMMNSSQDTKMNRIHEIFHTFGFDHPKGKGGTSGIMSYPPDDPDQNDANKIGNNIFLQTVIKNADK